MRKEHLNDLKLLMARRADREDRRRMPQRESREIAIDTSHSVAVRIARGDHILNTHAIHLFLVTSAVASRPRPRPRARAQQRSPKELRPRIRAFDLESRLSSAFVEIGARPGPRLQHGLTSQQHLLLFLALTGRADSMMINQLISWRGTT